MKKFVQYQGTEHLTGTFLTNGLTINNFYELIEESPSGQFAAVLNDTGVQTTYYAILFK